MTGPTTTWKVAVIGFDHMHAGDFIRAALDHPRAELAGLWDEDPDRVASVAADFGLDGEPSHADVADLIEARRPDIAVVCSTTQEHARWTEFLAERGVHVVVEKPFATSLEDADRMITATEKAGVSLAVNWPLAWYPVHRTTRRLIEAGEIGTVTTVHYYDGNRGPLHHGHDKIAVDEPLDARAKRETWWYQAARGGGSMLDYLGYGVTLATWFRDGELPLSVSATTHVEPGDEVDEQSVVVAAYARGLSVFQTRWGTFTDPWTHQPQPKCGFVVTGTSGTISSYDYEDHVVVQTRDHPEGVSVPVDPPALETTNGLAHVIDALERDLPITGPLSWRTSRAGQRVIDTAIASAAEGRLLPLAGTERN